MKNILKTLNDAIDRTSPNCHPVKRALLINKALAHRTMRLKKERAAWFIVASRPSEDRDFRSMVTYSCLSACYV